MKQRWTEEELITMTALEYAALSDDEKQAFTKQAMIYVARRNRQSRTILGHPSVQAGCVLVMLAGVAIWLIVAGQVMAGLALMVIAAIAMMRVPTPRTGTALDPINQMLNIVIAFGVLILLFIMAQGM